MKIIHKNGDVLHPHTINKYAKVIIPHVCNDIGGWGAGFVLALSKMWKEPEKEYRSKKEYILGDCDLIKVTNDIFVANMIGQHGLISNHNTQPIRYDAIKKALTFIKSVIVFENKNNEQIFEIHAPKFGCGLAGGSWDVIERILEDVFGDIHLDIVIYTF